MIRDGPTFEEGSVTRTGGILERLTVSVPEAARLLGVSRMTAYSAVCEGTIPSLRIGRRVLVPRAALDRLLAQVDPQHDTSPR